MTHRTAAGAIYYRAGVEDGFQQIEGLENVADVSISDDGNHIWACTDDNTVYYRPGIEAEWEEQAGKSTRVQVAGNGDHILFLNTSGNLYYRAGIADGFEALEGITDVAHMSMSADGKHIWATTTDQTVFYRAGPGAAEWEEQAGKSKFLHVGGNGEHLVFVNSSGDVYYRNGIENGFEKLEGASGMSHVTCSAVAPPTPKDVCFWGCNDEGAVL